MTRCKEDIVIQIIRVTIIILGSLLLLFLIEALLIAIYVLSGKNNYISI